VTGKRRRQHFNPDTAGPCVAHITVKVTRTGTGRAAGGRSVDNQLSCHLRFGHPGPHFSTDLAGKPHYFNDNQDLGPLWTESQ
jgi:hypothetical protein